MGFIIEQTKEMGEYSGEVRSESVVVRGESNFRPDLPESTPYLKRPHAIHVYENGTCGQGSIEFLIEDIPKIRAVLDAAEHVVAERSAEGVRI